MYGFTVFYDLKRLPGLQATPILKSNMEEISSAVHWTEYFRLQFRDRHSNINALIGLFKLLVTCVAVAMNIKQSELLREKTLLSDPISLKFVRHYFIS